MLAVRSFNFAAALVAICCIGALDLDGVSQPAAFAERESAVNACCHTALDGCKNAPCEPVGSTGCGCLSCCPTGLFPCWDSGYPWTLQGYLTGDCGDCSNISYGGWISAGAYANAHGAPNNGPVAMRNVGDGFTVNQVWGFFEKAVDTGGCGVDWGMRVDYVFGADGPDTQAFGSDPDAWDNPWDASRDYGSALPQLYGEIGINNLKVKLGHFYTIMGYEVVPATGNFFTSRAHTMYFAEPFTHTGVLAEYDMGNDITLWGGWVQGWDTGFDNPLGSDDFLGGVSLPLTEAVDFIWTFDVGHDDLTGFDYYLHSFVVDVAVTQKLEYVLQSDWGSSSSGDSRQWYGVNNYLFYTINDCWKLGTRMEWFRDDDSYNLPPGNYYELTWGLNWQPVANVRVRPELRYDWYDGPAAGVFDNLTQNDQLSGGFDVVVTF